ncbi:unnamed protein product [marine sediment metagenome]|uniref:Phage ABA sandwich domain-containing protein n=1 Tax=marine sediment metagenome TaxID=412755 RepID=X1A6Y0_9ZZZZ
MNEQELQELNKRLAERAGLEVHLTDTPTGKPEMWEKHGTTLATSVGWIDFPNDLNACFGRLVPKLLEEYNIESYQFRQLTTDGIPWYYSETSIWIKGHTTHGFDVLRDILVARHFEQGADLGKITALALCLAIKKLDDKREEDSK